MVRLQKKVLELEERLAAAETELKNGGRGLPGGNHVSGVREGGRGHEHMQDATCSLRGR